MIISPRRRTSSIAARTAVAIMKHALIISVMNSKHHVHRLFLRTIHLITHLPGHLTSSRYQKCYVPKIASAIHIANDVLLNLNCGPRTKNDGIIEFSWYLSFLLYILYIYIFFYFSRFYIFLIFISVFFIFKYLKIIPTKHPVKGTVISENIYLYQENVSFYILMPRQDARMGLRTSRSDFCVSLRHEVY